MSWDPKQYLKFADLRLRPALDLLARIPLNRPRRIFDLGCGAGNVTCQLALRWPEARITGVDSSPQMLAEAKARLPEADWIKDDLSKWQPSEPADLTFSNALFHWIKGHREIFPRLLDGLAPGGVLAVQMPRNQQEPSHILVREVAEAGPWRERLAHLGDLFEVLEPGTYHDLLRAGSAHLDVWESVYQQALTGEVPVLEWIKGTALRPYLAALADAPDLQNGFLAELKAQLAKAYPPLADGVTLLPFRRLFIVAVRPSAT